MKIDKNIFIIDIPRCELNQEVELVGIVIEKKDFNNGYYAIKIRDITGNVFCLINSSDEKQKDLYKNIQKNNKIKIYGSVTENSKGLKVISNVTDIKFLATLNSLLSVLDSEMQEQASRMLMSRICRKTSSIFQINQFTEIESRLISTHLYDDSLEPLQVIYPGFGPAVYLTTSPASQLINFMTTTIVSRAFTLSSSFVSSYRFPNGSAETKVIMAKSTNLTYDEQEELIIEIINKILQEVNKSELSITKLFGEWPGKIDTEGYFEKELPNDLNLIKFSANIPVIGKNWNSTIKTITQLLDKDKALLMECSRETLGPNSEISTITLYPSQFLSLIQKAPFRQLQNLTKAYEQ